MHYQSLVDEIAVIRSQEKDEYSKAMAAYDKATKNLVKTKLELYSQLLDVVVKDLFKLYPNLQSFQWEQSRKDVYVLVKEVVINGKAHKIFGNGQYNYIGTDEVIASMSQQEKAIAISVTNTIRKVHPEGCIERFGADKTVTARRSGFFVE